MGLGSRALVADYHRLTEPGEGRERSMKNQSCGRYLGQTGGAGGGSWDGLRMTGVLQIAAGRSNKTWDGLL